VPLHVDKFVMIRNSTGIRTTQKASDSICLLDGCSGSDVRPIGGPRIVTSAGEDRRAPRELSQMPAADHLAQSMQRFVTGEHVLSLPPIDSSVDNRICSHAIAPGFRADAICTLTNR